MKTNLQKNIIYLFIAILILGTLVLLYEHDLGIEIMLLNIGLLLIYIVKRLNTNEKQSKEYYSNLNNAANNNPVEIDLEQNSTFENIPEIYVNIEQRAVEELISLNSSIEQ